MQTYPHIGAFNADAQKMHAAGFHIAAHQQMGKKVHVTWIRDVSSNVPPTPQPKKGLPAIAIVGIVVGALILVGIVAAAIGGGKTEATATPAIARASTTSTGSVVGGAPQAGNANNASSATSAGGKIGDRVAIPGLAVTVFEVRDPAVSTNQFSKPKDGYRFVAVDFSIENLDKDPQSFNALYATIKDTTGRQYSTAFDNVVTPAMSAGKNSPGDKVRGWVTFEVPLDAKLVTFKYEPAFSGKQIVIDISK